jgi:CheY-like chemotaxis protein
MAASGAGMSEGKTTARTILVIDDNSYIRAIIANHLQGGGYATVEAADGDEALACARAGGVDLIYLDVMMPKVDGFEVLRELKKDPATVGIPVVIVTAYGQRENVIRATREGAVDFVVKPFTRETILEKARKFLPAEGA